MLVDREAVAADVAEFPALAEFARAENRVDPGFAGHPVGDVEKLAVGGAEHAVGALEAFGHPLHRLPVGGDPVDRFAGHFEFLRLAVVGRIAKPDRPGGIDVKFVRIVKPLPLKALHQRGDLLGGRIDHHHPVQGAHLAAVELAILAPRQAVGVAGGIEPGFHRLLREGRAGRRHAASRYLPAMDFSGGDVAEINVSLGVGGRALGESKPLRHEMRLRLSIHQIGQRVGLCSERLNQKAAGHGDEPSQAWQPGRK